MNKRHCNCKSCFAYSLFEPNTCEALTGEFNTEGRSCKFYKEWSDFKGDHAIDTFNHIYDIKRKLL